MTWRILSVGQVNIEIRKTFQYLHRVLKSDKNKNKIIINLFNN